MIESTFKPSEYNWTTVEQPGEIPLMIATRVLCLVRDIIEDVDAATRYIPEADKVIYKDTESEFEAASLIVSNGSSRNISMTLYDDNSTQVDAYFNGYKHSISADAMFSGPTAIPVIEFSRVGNGKTFGYCLEVDRLHRQQNLDMCWRIANVASVAMLNFRFRIEKGYWPNVN